MRERNRLASAIDGVEKLEQEVADTSELIEMAEADGDAAMASEGIAALRAMASEAKRREHCRRATVGGCFVTAGGCEQHNDAPL